MLKRPSYHFLHFTRKEKNGTIFLILFILLMIATPFFYSLIFKEKKLEIAEFKNELELLKMKSADSVKDFYKKKVNENKVSDYHDSFENNNSHRTSLFFFDPNTLPVSGWQKLGVNGKNISTIKNYLSKGGKFRQAGDIKKIWGLHEEQVKSLLPYIRIAAQEKTTSAFPVYEKKEYLKKTLAPIDINESDSLSYQSLPGIGPGYARRIMKFRDKLGGFYKTEQVAETFGLPDSVFQKIKPYLRISTENIKKININTATFDELKLHPYIRYQIGNAIIQYRTQHGAFSTVEDVKKIILITDEDYARFSPYLTVQ